MITQNDGNRVIKIIAIIAFVFISLALIIIARTTPANGYEISIYKVYPSYFWLCLLIPIIMPLFSLILNRQNNPTKSIYIIFAGALFSLITILSIPLFRGYPFYGAGDIHSHLGMVKQIFLDGRIGSNPYPVIHILVYVASAVSNYSPETISLCIPQFFISFYIISIFLLSRSLKCSTKEVLFVTAFAILPFLGVEITREYMMPATQSFFMIPITLYILIQSRNSNNPLPYSIMLIPLLMLFPFFHPESVIFLGVILIVFILVLKIDEKTSDATNNKKSIRIKKENFMPLLIFVVAFFFWFSSHICFAATIIKSVYAAFVFNLFSEGTPPLQSAMGGFHISTIDAVEIIIKAYGPALICLIFGGTIALFSIINFVLKKRYCFRDLFLSICFFLFATINIFFLLKGTAIGYHIYRQTKYSLFISTIILGIYFAKRFSQNKTTIKPVINSLLVFIILIASILAVYSIYSSPSTHGINYQPTNSDIQGMGFFFDYRNEDNLILESGGRAYQNRFGVYLLGRGAEKPAIRWGYLKEVFPPPHFGYNLSNNLGNFYASDQYLLIYPPSKEYYNILYPNYPNLWMFSTEDFNQLLLDPTVNRIYSNGALEIFTINGESG